jgi:hypothetical protein
MSSDYPHASLFGGLAMPSLFGAPLSAGAHEEGGLVLRSLYPSGSSASASAPPVSHAGAGMFDASSAFSAPLYRSVAMAPSQAPAPFEPFQLQHQQVNQHQAKFMTPLQAPSFSKKHMELPPSMEEVPVKAFEAPMLVAAEVPVSASSSNNCKCPSMPTYVEPHSHFFCTSALAAASLFEHVVSELRALHDCDDSSAAAASSSASSSQLERTIMDCAPVAGRFLVEVTAYASASGRACPFVVHLYDATVRKGANQFCVEFQRADSAPQCDRRHFFHLFNAARALFL